MKSNIQLLVIDPQNDFIDLPVTWCPPDTGAASRDALVKPALPVTGAHTDMLRLAAAIQSGIAGISGITVTLDSHHYVGIERTTFWVGADGAAVAPFTQITLKQVESGEFRPRNLAHLQAVKNYLHKLEARGRYTLCVWPVHCEIGTWGHAVHDAVRRACNAWEVSRQGQVELVMKGFNPMTEHYSPFRAEVPDSMDPHTQMNQALARRLGKADRIFVAGEASSHCVKAGVIDLADEIGANLSRIVLVRDAMSPVPGFEPQAEAFFADMEMRGLGMCTASEMAEALRANA